MDSNESARVPRDAQSGIVVNDLELQTLRRGAMALRIQALRDAWAGSHDLARERTRHADVLSHMPVDVPRQDRESAQVLELNAGGPPAGRGDGTPRAISAIESERQAILAASRTFREAAAELRRAACPELARHNDFRADVLEALGGRLVAEGDRPCPADPDRELDAERGSER